MKKILMFLLLGIFMICLVSSAVNVTLVSPTDNSNYYENPITFQSNIATTSGYITNVSLYTNISGTWRLNNITFFKQVSNITQISYSADNTPTLKKTINIGNNDSYYGNVSVISSKGWWVTDASGSTIRYKFYYYDGSTSWVNQTVNSTPNTIYNNSNPSPSKLVNKIEIYLARAGTSGTVYENNTIVYFFPSTNTNFTKNITDNGIIWNIYACNSINQCNFSSNNFTLLKGNIFINNITYSSSVLEGQLQTIGSHVTVESGLTLTSAVLNYNGTQYAGSFSKNGQNYTISKTITTPLVNAQSTANFYWTYTLSDSSSYNSTIKYQTINIFAVDNCSSYSNYIYNLSLVDEDTSTLINVSSPSITSSIKVSLQFYNILNSLNVLNYSGTFTDDNSVQLCSNVNLGTSSYRVDGVIEYEATDRFTEFYNIQNFTLNNNTQRQNITLYDLNSTRGQEFKVTYKDENFNKVIGALIQIQRKYVGEGVFKTVEIIKTGSDGFAVGHFIIDDAIYNLLIYKQGVLLATFTDVTASCQNPSFQSCEINVNSYASSIDVDNFYENGDFIVNLAFNKTSRVITAIFTSLSSGVYATTLNATLHDMYQNTTICNESLIASGGTLTCTIPATYINSSIDISVYHNGILKKQALVILNTDPNNIYQYNLVFIGIIMFLFLLGIGMNDEPAITLIILFLSIIIMTFLNIITSNSWYGWGASILYLAIAIGIILIKSGGRN